MNLSDELKKMRNKGRYVVSIDYVLDRLRESQSNECEHCSRIPIYETSVPKNRFMDFTRGGE